MGVRARERQSRWLALSVVVGVGMVLLLNACGSGTQTAQAQKSQTTPTQSRSSSGGQANPFNGMSQGNRSKVSKTMHILISEEITFHSAYGSWLKGKGASPAYDLTMLEGSLGTAATLMSEFGSQKIPGVVKAEATIATLRTESKDLDTLILKPHPGVSLQKTSWFNDMTKLDSSMLAENVTLSLIAALAINPTSTYKAWPAEPTYSS